MDRRGELMVPGPNAMPEGTILVPDPVTKLGWTWLGPPRRVFGRSRLPCWSFLVVWEGSQGGYGIIFGIVSSLVLKMFFIAFGFRMGWFWLFWGGIDGFGVALGWMWEAAWPAFGLVLVAVRRAAMLVLPRARVSLGSISVVPLVSLVPVGTESVTRT